MKKDYSSYRNYIEMVINNRRFFDNYYFHSIIDNDFIKIKSILENGILSKRDRDSLSIHSTSIHEACDFDSKNGEDLVSLSKCNYSFNLLFDSFALHTLSSVSFMISKDILVSREGKRESLFDDEVFSHSINTKYIDGILIPEHLSKSELSSIPLMGSNYYSLSKNGVFSYLKSVSDFLA